MIDGEALEVINYFTAFSGNPTQTSTILLTSANWSKTYCLALSGLTVITTIQISIDGKCVIALMKYQSAYFVKKNGDSINYYCLR
ncbi:MAG: hypothetical protein KBE91_08355 [Bacteroidia bacterium]|nr:hypothetical protein [Bacteroidia bacterium]MBP9689607.1 hypothetical protein [Bacteroidia bacterium]